MFPVYSLQGQGSGGEGLLEPGGNTPFPLAPDLLFSCCELQLSCSNLFSCYEL